MRAYVPQPNEVPALPGPSPSDSFPARYLSALSALFDSFWDPSSASFALGPRWRPRTSLCGINSASSCGRGPSVFPLLRGTEPSGPTSFTAFPSGGRVWPSSGPRPSSRGAARRFDSSGEESHRPGGRELMPRSDGSFGMASDNPTWGAPRIHGELLKLGFDVSERTVSRYLERIRPEPRGTGSQTWSTFLLNQAKGIVAVDLFTVPRVRFQVLYVFVVASSVPSAANSSIMSLCRVSVMRDGCFRSCRSGTTRTAFISLSRRTLLITGPSSRPRWVR